MDVSASHADIRDGPANSGAERSGQVENKLQAEEQVRRRALSNH